MMPAKNASFVSSYNSTLKALDIRSLDIWFKIVQNKQIIGSKSGAISDSCNHRGITVLPIFEKVFEIIVQRRLEFINEAFMRKDRFNGGFLKGSQTTDNLFILQSLIERQLSLGQNLIICFIDFSRAFDLMDRNILFYKLIKSGLHGRVINTLRNLYKKNIFSRKTRWISKRPYITRRRG